MISLNNTWLLLLFERHIVCYTFFKHMNTIHCLGESGINYTATLQDDEVELIADDNPNYHPKEMDCVKLFCTNLYAKHK